MSQQGWIGVDLDGTLAHYDHWRGEDHIGAPILPMVNRVKEWAAAGIEVRIMTARASPVTQTGRNVERSVQLIGDWTKKHIGVRLSATCSKDFAMLELWDDRCIQIELNTGRILGKSQCRAEPIAGTPNIKSEVPLCWTCGKPMEKESEHAECR